MKMSELKVNKITDMVCDLNEQEILDVVYSVRKNYEKNVKGYPERVRRNV